MIENGLRSEGIPGVFQATRVVLYAKAALPGVMGSALFGYIRAKHERYFYDAICGIAARYTASPCEKHEYNIAKVLGHPFKIYDFVNG